MSFVVVINLCLTLDESMINFYASSATDDINKMSAEYRWQYETQRSAKYVNDAMLVDGGGCISFKQFQNPDFALSRFHCIFQHNIEISVHFFLLKPSVSHIFHNPSFLCQEKVGLFLTAALQFFLRKISLETISQSFNKVVGLKY